MRKSRGTQVRASRRRGATGAITALVFVVCLAMLAGCAGFGQWSPTAQAKLDAWGVWADKWVGGAMANAPVIIAGLEGILGQSAETKAATAAVKAATAALGTYHAVVATGSGDPADAQKKLVDAMNAVNATVGAVKDTIKATGGSACLHPTLWWVTHVLAPPMFS